MVIMRMLLMLLALLGSGLAFAAGEAELIIRSNRPGSTVTVDRVVTNGKVLISVADAEKKPLFGLGAADFSVTQSGRTAMVKSVQPISESVDVPRHIVMVMDNSYSMHERQAVKELLRGVGELLKIVRPIDDVRMVVFDDKKTVNLGGRDLRVQIFTSNQPLDLQAFAARAYRTEGLTARTVLYEGILAGLDLIGSMPATEPRFMMVFSDGEDLNSAYKREVVLKVAQDVSGFNAYVIDYMPGDATDKFLTTFASQSNGQIWKARNETNLVPIFQSVASKMEYYYVLTYQFPPTGKLAVEPAGLTIEEVRVMGAQPATSITSPVLTLRPLVDSAYGISRWKVVVSNAKGVVAELAGEGAPAPQLSIPLPTVDLQNLAANGDLAVRMEIEDRVGQVLNLSSQPVTVKLLQTRASMAVAPASLTVEEIKTIDSSPMLAHIYFDLESSEIPPRYVRFAGPAETVGFNEQQYSTTLDKYYQDLNIIGKRLTERPEARITLVGCNDNSGREKGNKKLSARRAEAVREYLSSVWNIAAERMTVEARNLPVKPSASRLKEGQEENRRVEIVSTDPAILAPIRSTYLETRIDSPTLTLRPEVAAASGVATWRITASNASGTLADLAGKGEPAREVLIPLPAKDLQALAAAGDITVRMELQDGSGKNIVLAPDPVKVTFLQTSKRLAQKQDLRVQEKYALILFDFNRDTIDAANQEIINGVVARIKTLPRATVDIVGHTDNIGTEEYNLKLSQRRALSVYTMLSAAYGEAATDHIRHSGIGPNSPLYDNLTPEARSFNRTVTITLEYLSAE